MTLGDYFKQYDMEEHIRVPFLKMASFQAHAKSCLLNRPTAHDKIQSSTYYVTRGFDWVNDTAVHILFN